MKDNATVLDFEPNPPTSSTPTIGRLVELGPSGPVVDFPGSPRGSVTARTTVALDMGHVGAQVVLLFERDRVDLPIVIGVLRDDVYDVHARVDGKRVVVSAEDEIVLACGDATIVLRRNGRVIVRGTHVETRSRGVNKIKGGTVQIN
jgi:hypothetical protein